MHDQAHIHWSKNGLQGRLRGHLLVDGRPPCGLEEWPCFMRLVT